eukprot:PhM_4_TR9393/c0_g1_i1/m.65197
MSDNKNNAIPATTTTTTSTSTSKTVRPVPSDSRRGIGGGIGGGMSLNIRSHAERTTDSQQPGVTVKPTAAKPQDDVVTAVGSSGLKWPSHLEPPGAFTGFGATPAGFYTGSASPFGGTPVPTPNVLMRDAAAQERGEAVFPSPPQKPTNADNNDDDEEYEGRLPSNLLDGDDSGLLDDSADQTGSQQGASGTSQPPPASLGFLPFPPPPPPNVAGVIACDKDTQTIKLLHWFRCVNPMWELLASTMPLDVVRGSKQTVIPWASLPPPPPVPPGAPMLPGAPAPQYSFDMWHHTCWRWWHHVRAMYMGVDTMTAAENGITIVERPPLCTPCVPVAASSVAAVKEHLLRLDSKQ